MIYDIHVVCTSYLSISASSVRPSISTCRYWQYIMPTCLPLFSVAVQQLLIMAYETLHEAQGGATECAQQYCIIVRNIFELFLDVVPTYHRDKLLKLPLLSGMDYQYSSENRSWIVMLLKWHPTFLAKFFFCINVWKDDVKKYINQSFRSHG